jgi:hypothetical protein
MSAAKMDSAVRAKTLPYVESVMKIRAAVAVLEGFRSDPSRVQGASEPKEALFSKTMPLDSKESFDSSQNAGQSSDISLPPDAIARTSKAYHISAQSLKRKYPRFTANLYITDALVAEAETTPRSDIWLVNMMEQCYDEAVEATAKPVHGSEAKAGPKKRCGLSLGCLVSFASIVNKFLGRIYGFVLCMFEFPYMF